MTKCKHSWRRHASRRESQTLTFNSKNIIQLTDYINRLFSDDDAPVTLCTVHKAKGLEADRGWIIEPNIMSASWKHQQDWQREQEHNLLYVALTRAKQNLFIVGNADWCRNLDDVWDGHLRTCNAVIPDSLQQGDLALLLNLR